MNRRHFLGSLAALSAGMALDADKLLWVPGRKTYFDIVRPVPSVPYIAFQYEDGTVRYYTERDPMPADWYTNTQHGDPLIKARIVMIDQLSFS